MALGPVVLTRFAPCSLPRGNGRLGFVRVGARFAQPNVPAKDAVPLLGELVVHDAPNPTVLTEVDDRGDRGVTFTTTGSARLKVKRFRTLIFKTYSAQAALVMAPFETFTAYSKTKLKR